MSINISKRLVIDVSIAMSSGGEQAIHPTSKHCRDFLKAVLDLGHQITMTDDMADEWRRHQSNSARKWRLSMYARRRIYFIKVKPFKGMRQRLGRATKIESHREAMLKDLLLIEAALATDKIVFSLDEAVRRLFREATASVVELKDILWANPDKDDDECIVWLEGGAKIEKKRLLGSVAKL